MKILQEAKNTMAYFKCGIFGFQGSGKTFTATDLATGVCKATGITKLAYFDTETGSDFMLKKLREGGFTVFQVKSRAFSDLLGTIKECESENSFLIIDSLTHVWRDLMSSYDRKFNRNGRLQFQDWALIKGEWQLYADLFVNSKAHIIACGRAGYDYDYDINEDGSKDLVKTGTKFKAEGEFGFEPSLVIEMQRLSENKLDLEKIDTSNKRGRDAKRAFQPKIGSQSVHRMYILKDRTDTLNGCHFDYYRGCENTPFEDIKPHFDNLNIGGEHLGYGDKDSGDRFDKHGKPDWAKERELATIALEEISAEVTKYIPGSSAKEKQAKVRLSELVFGTASSKALEGFSSQLLRQGLSRMKDIFSVPENTIENIADGKILEPPPLDVPEPEEMKGDA